MTAPSPKNQFNHLSIEKRHEMGKELMLKLSEIDMLHLSKERKNATIKKSISLIRSGASLTLTGRNDKTALILAIICKLPTVVTEILKRDDFDIDATDNFGNTALILNARHGDAITAKKLIEKGAEIDKENNAEFTAFTAAAEAGNLPVAKELMAHGADINKKSEMNAKFTPLIHAARGGHVGVVDLILAKTASDIDHADKVGWTALMQACHNGRHKVVKKLLEYNANIDLQNNNGDTGATLSAQSLLHEGHIESVKHLIDHDADLTIKNDFGVNAIWYIETHDRHDIIEYQKEHMHKKVLEKKRAIQKRRQDICDQIDKGTAAPFKRPKKASLRRPPKKP